MDNLFDARKKMIYEYITSKEYTPMKIKQIAAVIGVPSEDKEEIGRAHV